MRLELFLLISLLFLPVLVLAQQQQQSVVILNDGNIKSKKNFTKNDLVKPVYPREFFSENDSDFISLFQQKPGFAFTGSAIVPGFSQAANNNWIRAGLFMAIEVTSVLLMINLNHKARKGEQDYENWADRNWSVVQYSSWLVNYHDENGLSNPYIDDLREMLEGVNPEFDTTKDWNAVNLSLLRNVERHTPFITTDSFTANTFSHTLPDYGSQQYYELIAKYYQYQAGWKDYHQYHDELGHTGGNFNERFLIDRNGNYASPFFFEGALMAERFNNQYRSAGHFTSLMIINHILSAFDAYFSIKVKQNRLHATSSLTPGQQIKMTYRF